MTSQKPINNPFRRIITAEDYRNEEEAEAIDIDGPEEQEYGNYDYGNDYGNENDYDQTAPQSSGGFTMSDNLANQKPKQPQANSLVINKPKLQAEQSPPPVQYKQNTLGAHAYPGKPPMKQPFKPPVNPFAKGPPLPKQSHNNPFANKTPVFGQQQQQHQQNNSRNQNEDSPYPVSAPRRDSMEGENLEDGGADEPSFTDISPSQSQFNKPKANNKAKKLANVHNPFVDNGADSPSAPSSGTDHTGSSRQQHQMQAEGKEQRPVDPNDPFADEPSILEELEIDPVKIKNKFIAILTYRGLSDMETALYHDMAGPLLVIFLFGLSFLFKGRIEFGNIYGFSLTGCIGLYCIINLLSKPGQYAELYSCISILGYSLLPFCFLAVISIFIDMNNVVGYAVCTFFVLWSTATATRIFEHTLDMEDKKYLIGYPIILFYGIFVQLTVL